MRWLQPVGDGRWKDRFGLRVTQEVSYTGLGDWSNLESSGRTQVSLISGWGTRDTIYWDKGIERRTDSRCPIGSWRWIDSVGERAGLKLDLRLTSLEIFMKPKGWQGWWMELPRERAHGARSESDQREIPEEHLLIRDRQRTRNRGK